MNYETPSAEVTLFDIREKGLSQGNGNFACPTQTGDTDL